MEKLAVSCFLGVALSGSVLANADVQYDLHRQAIEQMEQEAVPSWIIDTRRDVVVCGLYTSPPADYIVDRYINSFSCGFDTNNNAYVATKVSTSRKYHACGTRIPQGWVIIRNGESMDCATRPEYGPKSQNYIQYATEKTMNICGNSSVPDSYYVSDYNATNYRCNGDNGKIIKRR